MSSGYSALVRTSGLTQASAASPSICSEGTTSVSLASLARLRTSRTKTSPLLRAALDWRAALTQLSSLSSISGEIMLNHAQFNGLCEASRAIATGLFVNGKSQLNQAQ